MTEAPMTPGLSSNGGRQVLCEKPRQFQERWLEAMEALPSQVLRPLREALKIHRSREYRLRSLDAARCELGIIKPNSRIYSDSVDAKIQELNVENVDPSSHLQADAFLARLGNSGRKALEKRQRVASAIAYAEMTIEWLEWELSHGD